MVVLIFGVTEITWAIPWSAIKWTSVSDDASQPVSQLDVERLDKLEKDGSQALFVYPLPEAILESQRLASESQSILEKNPETAILVALKANEYAHTFESENAFGMH